VPAEVLTHEAGRLGAMQFDRLIHYVAWPRVEGPQESGKVANQQSRLFTGT